MPSKTTSASVYSYIRFSTPEQAIGDSERRQLDEARQWATRNGHTLDESLRLTDRGLSGYHGDHRKKGALGRFLEAVEAGRIPPGSILLVENVDRLSREGAANTLRQIIFKLWDKGVTIQTLSPAESYEPGCDSHPKFLALFLYLQRAQDESQRKSERIRKAREQARQKAHDEKQLLTERVPAWLVVNGDRLEPNAEATKALRFIFESKHKGIGLRTIEAQLNSGPYWKPPKNKKGKGGSWRASYIRKILGNRAVIGEYQPHQRTSNGRKPVGDPIPDYYPVVVPPKLCHAVQKQMAANRVKTSKGKHQWTGKGGRIGKAKNLLRHLVVCGYCGGSMAFIDRGPRPKGGQYLVCDNGRRCVKCKRYSIRYDECEKLILDNCPDLRPEHVLPNPDEQSKLCYALHQQIEGGKAELETIERQIVNLVDQVSNADNPSIRNRYQTRISELEARQAILGKEIEAAESQRDAAQAGLRSLTNWKKTLKGLKQELKAGNVEVRMRMQAHLQELIQRIEVYAVGGTKQRYKTPWVYDAEEKAGDPMCDGLRDEPQLPLSVVKRFAKYVDQRLRGKEGRFLRVYFRAWADSMPPLHIDLVPDGSLAIGALLARPEMDVVDQWDGVEPNFSELWRGFTAKQPAG